MTVIDERGALFGRFNLIDAAVAMFVLVLVPMGYVAYRVFRVPPPVIASVAPPSLAPNVPRRIRVTGEHFRPYLKAFVAKTGEPFSLSDRLPNSEEVVFLIETPDVVELKLPDLPPGSYDLYLYDEGREIAKRTPAFTIEAGAVVGDTAAPAPSARSKDVAKLELAVRFDVDADIAALPKAGDKDLNQPEGGFVSEMPATLISVRSVPSTASDVTFHLAAGRLTVDTTPRVRLEMIVRLGVMREKGVWVATGPQRVRSGQPFTFATSSYVLYNGVVSRLTVLPGSMRDEATP